MKTAALVGAIMLALPLTPAPASAVDYDRPCDSINDTNCTLTAVHASRPDGAFLRKVGDGSWENYTPEVVMIRSLDSCRTAVDHLSSESRSQFFELQDLRARVTIAEGNLTAAQRENKRLAAKVQRLREKLRSR